MARTPSNMLPLGTKIPKFKLQDTAGYLHNSDACAGKPTLIMFICNHCPFVIHVREELARIGRDYTPRGLKIIAINSNDHIAYPDDSPEKMREERQRAGYVFPYLFDATQAVAKEFQAACTPDFYLFDAASQLVYRGQLDDSRPSNGVPVTGRDLRAAIEAVLTGVELPYSQKPSLGCNIKWRDA